MKVALVCIAKNEDNYIDEWINYNLKLGFDRIFIYSNNWEYECHNEKVSVIPFPGEVKQTQSYNTFINDNRENYDWAAFFDVDEFLVLKKHNNIKEFISDYIDRDSIAINWVLFGDNNHTEIINNNYSVLSRFTKRQIGVNLHIKVIVKIKDGVSMSGPHSSCLNWVDTNGNIGRGPFNRNGDDNIAQLNHYFCKTKIEFEDKIKRGRSDSQTFRSMSEFDPHNSNDVEDLLALNFYKN